MPLLNRQPQITENRLELNAEQRKNTRPDIDRTNVVFADSGVSMEIVTLDNGKQYVRSTEKVIKGNDVSKWSGQVAYYINSVIRKWGDFKIKTVEGDELTITRDTAYKAGIKNYIVDTKGIHRPMTDAEYKTKLNAEVHINELAEIARHKKSMKIKKDTKNHRFAKDGFIYRTAFFQDVDGEYYKITISIGLNNSVSTVYNVGKIEKDTLPDGEISSTVSGSKADIVSSLHTIPLEDTLVNSDFMKNEEKIQKMYQKPQIKISPTLDMQLMKILTAYLMMPLIWTCSRTKKKELTSTR